MLPGKKYSPEEWLDVVWRRKWLVVIPAMLIALTTVVVSFRLPDRYRSETLILVVPQQVPESYVRSTVTMKIEDRLRSVQQQILSRTRLEQIVREFKLYPDAVKRLPMEDVIEMMRRDVAVEIVRRDAFRVSYTSDQPKRAMEVAARVGSLVMDENEQDRQVLAEDTADFLTTQLDEARRRLADQEKRVAEFQRQHAGELPSQRDSNLQVLHNLQLQVQALLDSANRDRDRRLFLERTLADLDAEAQSIRSAVQTTPADAAAGVAPGATAAEQLASAQEALRVLELRLKPGHPDVLYAKRMIRDLEAKARAEAANPVTPGAASPAGSGAPRGRTLRPEEAITIRRAQETRQELAAVESQLQLKQTEEKRLRDQIADFQRKIAATPGLEAEFTSLTRDYDTQQKGYQSLLAKQEDSKVAAALEARQIGERFKVLDRARLPEAPFSPKRWLINLGGVFGGLAFGLGLVMLLEYRDRSLRTEDDVLKVLGLPVLAAIPVIHTRRDRQRAKRTRVIGIAAAALSVMLVGVAFVAWRAGWVHVPQSLRW